MHKERLEDGCWWWLGTFDEGGYGRFFIGWDAEGKQIIALAHHVSWWLAHGDWPDYIRHICDNPSCQRPDHLEPGTHQENMDDMNERGRAVYVQGASAGGAKLTEAQAIEVIALRSNGLAYKDIASMFGLHKSTVVRIVKGDTWKHLQR